MNDNESGTVSFESVKSEQKAPKNEKPDMKKILLIAIISVFVTALLLFCAVIIAEVVHKNVGDPTYEGEVIGGIEYANGKINYTDREVSSSSTTIGDLLIINSSNQISAEARNKAKADIVNAYNYINNSNLPMNFKLQDTEKIKLTPEAISNFCVMMSDLKATTGCGDVLVSYGYLDIANATYSVLDCDYIQELGTSVYVKIQDATGTHELTSNMAVYNWLNANCAKYGFINTGIDDNGEKVPARQFRYIGAAHASYMKEKGMSYGEYISHLKAEFSDKNKAMTIKAEDEKCYAVYYIANPGSSIRIPSNYNYTVSGDNMGGLIVTVNLSVVYSAE